MSNAIDPGFSAGLSEKHELLLCRYFDGECGFFERRAAQTLLNRNIAAREFFEQLSSIRKECEDFGSDTTPASVDLWDRISARIDVEERTALYSREGNGTQRERSADSFFNPRIIFGGLSGAVVAALALVFITQPNRTPSDLLTVVRGATWGSFDQVSPLTQISTGSGARSGSPIRLALNRMPEAHMEVDWIRSQGQLSLIQNPRSKSAIIWVRRKGKSALRAAPNTVPASPTQVGLLRGLLETAMGGAAR